MSKKIQYYWEAVLGGREEVTVKSRAEQRKCDHEFQQRYNPNRTRHGNSWRRVCKFCGACTR